MSMNGAASDGSDSGVYGVRAEDSEGAASATGTRRRWPLRFLAVALIAVSLVAGGILLGWRADGWVSARQPAPGDDERIVYVPEVAAFDGEAIPDLRGTTKTEAMTALGDLGFDTSVVEVEESPWAGSSGMVIGQDPAPGERVEGSLVITVSSEARVPKVEGMDRTEATEAIRALGGEAVIVEVFDAESDPHTVIGVDPAAGEPLPATVTLRTVDPGSSVFLADLMALESSCSSEDTRLNGTDQPRSLLCSTSEEGEISEWDLGRKVSRIEMTVGVPDDSQETEGAVTVVVLADGEEVARASAAFGEEAALSANVEGSLRLRVVTLATEQ